MASLDPSNIVKSLDTGLFIGGRWQAASNGRRLSVENPATGKPLAEVADASVADGVAALDAACAAQRSWAAVPPRQRGEMLRRAYDLLTE